jgi:2-polyprenyl-6-methoxyphenol hydroxylase-like FAD-dependent oxidoreductase
MRKIAIVGAGLGGCVLANALLDRGYAITLLTDRSAADIRNGFVLSTQSIWAPAVAMERTLGLNNWENQYRGIGGFHVRFNQTAGGGIQEFTAPLTAPGQSIDFRVKLPALMERFAARGGSLVVRSVDIDDFCDLADSHDLVIAATGRARGELRDLFPRNDQRSTAHQPLRVGAVVYLDGRKGPPSPSGGAPFEEWTIIPGVGEFFVIPAFSLRGDCQIICVEGCVGGPIDCWHDVKTPDQCFRRMREVIERWMPWEHERCRDIGLIDDRAAISGGFTPVVRHPVGHLPNRRPVLAFGDLFVLNDPLVAQGGNTAIKLATMLVEDIVEQGKDHPFDAEWMTGYSEKAWHYASWTVALSDLFLSPNENLWRWLGKAASVQAVADTMILGYEDPKKWVDMLLKPASPDL